MKCINIIGIIKCSSLERVWVLEEWVENTKWKDRIPEEFVKQNKKWLN